MERVDADVVVIGAGIAGLVAAQRLHRPESSAALPARTIVLEAGPPGGLLNWGGRNAFHIAGPRYKLGVEDWTAILEDVRALGVTMLEDAAAELSLGGAVKEIRTREGRTLRAHAVILATGAFPLKNAASFRRRDGLITVFGPASQIRETAARVMQKTERSRLLLMGPPMILGLARHLAPLSPQVLVEPPFDGPLPAGARVGSLERILGDPRIEGVEYRDEEGALRRLDCDTIYVDFNAYMERTSATRYLAGTGVALDKGFVVTDRSAATNLPGVFAAGDVTGGMFAVSKSIYEGNLAGFSALRYLHATRHGFEPSFHPFFYGDYGVEIGVFHRRPGVRLALSSDGALEVHAGGAARRYGLTPELLPLARAIVDRGGTFHAAELGVPLEGLSTAVLFELVRAGALGVGPGAVDPAPPAGL